MSTAWVRAIGGFEGFQHRVERGQIRPVFVAPTSVSIATRTWSADTAGRVPRLPLLDGAERGLVKGQPGKPVRLAAMLVNHWLRSAALVQLDLPAVHGESVEPHGQVRVNRKRGRAPGERCAEWPR